MTYVGNFGKQLGDTFHFSNPFIQLMVKICINFEKSNLQLELQKRRSKRKKSVGKKYEKKMWKIYTFFYVQLFFFQKRNEHFPHRKPQGTRRFFTRTLTSRSCFVCFYKRFPGCFSFLWFWFRFVFYSNLNQSPLPSTHEPGMDVCVG